VSDHQAIFTIGEAAQAIGVSIDTLRRWDREGRVEFTRRNGHRLLDGEQVARLLNERAQASQTPSRNRFAGIVLAINRTGKTAQIELSCGPFRVVSVMPTDTADALGLRPGSRADAVLNATSIAVEAH
jgi:excisionase family DNA binding protein